MRLLGKLSYISNCGLTSNFEIRVHTYHLGHQFHDCENQITHGERLISIQHTQRYRY